MLYVTLSVLLLHLVLSLLNQFDHLQTALAKINRIGFLPYWSFFAPFPGTTDHRLVFAAKSEHHDPEWAEVPLYESRKLSHLFWNRSKHLQKCFSDTIIYLLKSANEINDSSPDLIQVNWAYITLASIAEKRVQDGAMYRFAIFSSEGMRNRTLVPLFISGWHTR